ncbi:MAG TPA: magnesium transporter [Actinomycetota bacterium]|nr:magnesium transporter [Actinomycetota bacterium]
MALPRPARHLRAYFRAERRTLRQGLVALVLSTVASFFAGLTLGSITGTLNLLPGLLVLIPASVGMRGTVFGAIGARLGTGIHAGLFEPVLRRDSLLGRNVEVGLISSVLSSFYLAAMAKVVAAAFGEGTISFWDLLTISMVGGVAASVVILLVTVGIALLSFRRGWDLDAVSTPMVTAIGDMVTLPALFLASFIPRSDVLNAVVATGCVALAAIALVAGTRTERVTRRILAEMAGVILLVPLLDIVAGALLEARRTSLELVPAVLILIPPFVSQAGALGGILSSRLSSKLQLGVITPRGRPEPPALVDGAIVVAFGVLVFTAIGAIAVGLENLTGLAEGAGVLHPSGASIVAGTLLAGLLVLPVTLVSGYYIAVVTTRFGLDPDNQGVPIITSLMDLVGVAAILFAMGVSGVIVHG